ncbi:mannose-6-phosphate isomerase [Sistotremastrum niveocremeum HHB9708]|uniref:Mannose-6-phosphate isomerase n=1 Tax=Sistotremastrum niveocremeum HHB9708 TaxID=1314777 RepID=A0A164WW21_9AGAM|nr:mannose-6-phosphate isomerase [Sistotremastrum niveocremeum HHB9708]
MSDTTNATLSVVRLKCSTQTYDWGKQGSESLVARLAPAAVGPEFELDENTSYAEIWMGTHPNGPSSLYDSTYLDLKSLLATNPTHYLGNHVIDKFNDPTPEIPFLFKILSIRKALPLQAHPDKRLAEKLNKKDAENFVDSNHKPEIALALSPFKGFVGFRPIDEIRQFVKYVPELHDLIDKDPGKSMKEVISTLLQTPEEELKGTIESLVARCKEHPNDEVAGVVVKLNEQYPGDVGILIAPFFMNLVTLEKGEAIYIGADEAHAYLEGDIVECMAISDNVVNSAFCPASDRDPETFSAMLTYTSRAAKDFALPHESYPGSRSRRTIAYNPPLEEFTVLRTTLSQEGDDDILLPAKGPSIGIVVQGSAVVSTCDAEPLQLDTGAVVFVAANQGIKIKATAENTEMYWSTVIE